MSSENINFDVTEVTEISLHVHGDQLLILQIASNANCVGLAWVLELLCVWDLSGQ